MDRWSFTSINIPLNESGVADLENGTDSSDVRTFGLSEEEIDSLMSLFHSFNSRFGCLIDIAEEEVIANENLEEAKVLALNYLKDNPHLEPAIKKVLESIAIAIENGTFIEIDL